MGRQPRGARGRWGREPEGNSDLEGPEGLAPYRETGQVRVLRIIGASCLTIGEGRYRYETGMARRISVGLDWNRTSWCGVHGFQY